MSRGLEMRLSAKGVACLALVATALAPRVALAEDAPDDPAALFGEAQALYESGDTAGALVKMRRAYELSQRAELHFNLGELEHELGDCSAALDDYRAYLTAVGSGARRDQAEARVQELEATCPSTEPAPAPPPAPAAVTPPAPAPAPVVVAAPPPAVHAPPPEQKARYWTPLRIAGWSTVGAGVVSGALAGYFAIRAANDESDLEASFRSAGSTGFSRKDKELETDGQRSAQIALALGIGAGALAAVGTTLLLLPISDREERRPRISLVGGPTGFSAGWETSF